MENHTKENKQRASAETELLKQTIISAIADVKGKDVVELNLKGIEEAVTDYFIVCHGDSTTQVNALATTIRKEVKQELGEIPFGTEGKETANWIVVDYFDVVVHIFHRETREFYQLEELWSDAEVTEHN